jgi:hypothetical protein
MNSKLTRVLLGLLVLVGASAMVSRSFDSSSFTTTRPGAVRIVASLLQSMPAEEVAQVQAILSGPNMPKLVVPLKPMGIQWEAEIGMLPASDGNTLVVEALDARGDVVLTSLTSGISVFSSRTVLAAMVVQKPAPQLPPTVEGPRIAALVSSSVKARPGEFLKLDASVLGIDPYNPQSYQWTASAGVLSSPTSVSTSWTAPSSPTPVIFTFKVEDGRGASASASFSIVVDYVNVTPAHVSFDHGPLVTQIAEPPEQVKLGQSTPVGATVADEEPGSLTYEWSAACPGLWEDASLATARFIPGYQGGSTQCTECSMDLTVTDRLGSRITRKISMCVSPEVAPEGLAQIEETRQSSPTAGPREDVTFEVKAMDPLRKGVSFSWSASEGTLGEPTGNGSMSEVVWTAPQCVKEGDKVSVTATATNELGAQTVPFSVSGLPPCIVW